MMKIKIVVSGIGGVGGYYGGLLAACYRESDRVEVSFVSRGENLRSIRERGLLIRQPGSEFTACPAVTTDRPSDIGVADYLLCCTKGYSLDENLRQLEPVIGRNTVIVPFLNGIDWTERIAARYPDVGIWQGCVYIGARLTEPGVVDRFSFKERLCFGSETADPNRLSQLLSCFSEAGINAICPDDIAVHIWKKFFMISTAATLTSYYDLPIDRVIDRHYDRFIELGMELWNLALARGIELPQGLIADSVEAQRMMPAGSTTSMHSDFQRGGPTELEYLTGHPLREGDRLGIAMPLYGQMYRQLAARCDR